MQQFKLLKQREIKTMGEFITMSNKELRRIKTTQALKDKRITQRETALELSLSIRQIKNLYKNYKKHGEKGLISKKRGKPSNRQLPKIIKDQAIGLIFNSYIDFGPTFAHEKLKEKYFLNISVSTVRNLMISNNIWKTKKSKKRKVYQLRDRRKSTGSHSDLF